MINSIKIELGAILALKNVIQIHDLMKDYINENDKEPSWDGYIYLYKSDDLKVENIKYKVPVQVKGKNDESLLKRQRISFSVEYKHLRNYYHDGGVFYVVVAISDDKRKTTIFYKDLTTVKLNSLLKNSEGKKPEQTKNIVLEKLKNSDPNVLFQVLTQFGYDKEQQGSGNGAIIEKAINIDVIDKVDSVRFTSYSATNETEALKQISTGEVCLYGHRADLDMWLPFDYEHQKEIRLKTVLEMNKSIGIDNVTYYDKYIVERYDTDAPIIRVSENLTIDLIGGKLQLEMHGNIESLKKDVDFLQAVLQGHSFWVDGKQVTEYANMNISESLQNDMDLITDFYHALNEIDFVCDKKIDDFDEKNREAVVRLVNLYHRKVKLKEERNNEWRMWWWDDRVIPLLVVKDDNEEIQIVNWIAKDGYITYSEEAGQKHIFPRGMLFKRDIWEKLYDVDEEILLRDIERSDFDEFTSEELYLFFVEILSAYDTTKNEKYYDMAKLIITKLLEVDEENEYGIINQLQLLKRKRELSAEEVDKLESLEVTSEDDMVVCAVNVLLENKHKARKLISQLSPEKQEMFKDFPIYNLL